MIEQTVIEYLSSALEVPVDAEIPKGPPDRYVVVEKTGSDEQDGLLWATLAVQSTAPSLYETMRLNAEVKAAMKGLITLTNVFRCHCETDYNFTDTRLKGRRYQAVFQIVYKE